MRGNPIIDHLRDILARPLPGRGRHQDGPPIIDHLRDILARAEARLNRAFEDARARGLADRTFLVVELHDMQALAIAGLRLTSVIVKGIVAQDRRNGTCPRMIVALERPEAARALAEHFPEPAADLMIPAAEGYLAVVLAEGVCLVAEIRPSGPEGAHPATSD